MSNLVQKYQLPSSPIRQKTGKNSWISNQFDGKLDFKTVKMMNEENSSNPQGNLLEMMSKNADFMDRALRVYRTVGTAKQKTRDFYNSDEYRARVTRAAKGDSKKVNQLLNQSNRLLNSAKVQAVDSEGLSRTQSWGVNSLYSRDYLSGTRGVAVRNPNLNIYGVFMNTDWAFEPSLLNSTIHELSHWVETRHAPWAQAWNESLINGHLRQGASSYHSEPTEIRARALPIWLEWQKNRKKYDNDLTRFLREHTGVKNDPAIGRYIQELRNTFKDDGSLENYLRLFVQNEPTQNSDSQFTPSEYKQYYA